MTEDEARRVVLVQVHEAGEPSPLWTEDDRLWASRAARQDGAPDFERFVVLRARHALERLLPRDGAARRWLQRRAWRPAWVAGMALLAFVLGAAADHIGSPQRVDLLAPPVWAIVAWNLVVYVGLLVPHPARGLRRSLARRWQGGPRGVRALWALPATPLALTRAALALHVAAAALALGVVGGMYLRGLVLDYRAGWQSTFLDAPLVQGVLNVALAPAAAVTGIGVPDVAPLRLAPGSAASASAAPWIHLYAATLLLAVVLPRLALAFAAGVRALLLARRFPLPLQGAYFERLKLQQQGGRAFVDVRPHGAPLTAQAALGLRALLAAVWADALELRIAEPVGYGNEEQAAPAPAGATLRLALFDLGTTPEDEAHGRLIDTLRGPLPLLVLADEAAFRRRFGTLPERMAERRAVWQRFAERHGARLVSVDLETPALEDATRQLKAALA
jgi:hypothetical protein